VHSEFRATSLGVMHLVQLRELTRFPYEVYTATRALLGYVILSPVQPSGLGHALVPIQLFPRSRIVRFNTEIKDGEVDGPGIIIGV
jgi:hypothetical protein